MAMTTTSRCDSLKIRIFAKLINNLRAFYSIRKHGCDSLKIRIFAKLINNVAVNVGRVDGVVIR